MTDERRNDHMAAPSGVPEVPPAPGEADGGWAPERPPEADAERDESAEDVTPTSEAEDRARPL